MKIEEEKVEYEELLAEKATVEEENLQLQRPLLREFINASQETNDLFALVEAFDQDQREVLAAYFLDLELSVESSEDLQLFLEKNFTKEIMEGIFSLLDEEVYGIWSSLCGKSRPINYDEIHKISVLLDGALAFLCESKGEFICFVPEKVARFRDEMDLNKVAETRKALSKHYDFAVAACNLYGVIPMDQLWGIYQHYENNEEEYEDFLYAIDNYRHQTTLIAHVGDLIMFDFLLHDEEGLQDLLRSQGKKPRYIPVKKEEFLCYISEDYFRPNVEYKTLRDFFLNIRPDEEEVDQLMSEIIMCQKFSHPMDMVFRTIVNNDFLPNQDEDQKTMVDMLISLDQQSRKWENKGSTPQELHEEMPYFQENPQDAKGNSPSAPSKNGPCPCGSGKKHKRCCGK